MWGFEIRPQSFKQVGKSGKFSIKETSNHNGKFYVLDCSFSVEFIFKLCSPSFLIVITNITNGKSKKYGKFNANTYSIWTFGAKEIVTSLRELQG